MSDVTRTDNQKLREAVTYYRSFPIEGRIKTLVDAGEAFLGFVAFVEHVCKPLTKEIDVWHVESVFTADGRSSPMCSVYSTLATADGPRAPAVSSRPPRRYPVLGGRP